MHFQKGFILVTTLWVLAMLTVAAGFFALWTQRTVIFAQTLQMDLQREIEMYNTQANIIYLLTTQRFTIAGLTVPPKDKKIAEAKEKTFEFDDFEEESILPIGNEIALDDRPYFGHGKAYFALQDEGGLYSLTIASDLTLNRLLSLLGVASGVRASLIDKFQDYIDLDDLHRLNGAEAYHYEQNHLLPPTNHFLRNSLEIQNVMGWSEQTSLWQNNLFGQLTTTLGRYPNFNTAPSEVLQAFYNINAENAKSIINQRQTMPFYTLYMISQAAGVDVDIDPYYINFFPASFLRLTLWYAGAQRMRQIYIQLTPNANDKKPWQIEYRLESNLIPSYTATTPRHAQTTIFTSTLPAKTQ